jgi:signal transduction histidine kinase
MQTNIFSRYFRVDDENGISGPGLGLGLYIVAEIVKLHGGTISLNSEVNKGSTFCFSIPL